MNKYRVKRHRNKPKKNQTHNKGVNVYTDSDLRLVLINHRIVLGY